MSDTKRQSGYYKAKRHNEPLVLKYESEGDYFTVCGVEHYFEESDFTDIEPIDFHKEQSTQSESETTDSLLKRAAFLGFLARVDSTLKDCQPVYEKYTKNYDEVQEQIEKVLSDIPKFLEKYPAPTSETELSGKLKEAVEIIEWLALNCTPDDKSGFEHFFNSTTNFLESTKDLTSLTQNK
jgi:hypothetical protein